MATGQISSKNQAMSPRSVRIHSSSNSTARLEKPPMAAKIMPMIISVSASRLSEASFDWGCPAACGEGAPPCGCQAERAPRCGINLSRWLSTTLSTNSPMPTGVAKIKARNTMNQGMGGSPDLLRRALRLRLA